MTIYTTAGITRHADSESRVTVLCIRIWSRVCARKHSRVVGYRCSARDSGFVDKGISCKPDPVSGRAYDVMLGMFAAMPLLVARKAKVCQT